MGSGSRDENFGRKFVQSHYDAEMEFYWNLKAAVDVPKNKVLTGLAQQLQRNINGQLFVGIFKRGYFDYNHLYPNFQELCNRSLNDVIVVDQFGEGYTGRQFLDIVASSEFN